MKQRLFAAVTPDSNCLDAIEAALAAVTQALTRQFTDVVRFTPKENWHITIAFLGYQDEASVPAITTALHDAAAAFAPPQIRVTDIAYSNPPRMVWALLDSVSSAALGALRDRFETKLRQYGLVWQKDTRPISHITLARFDPYRYGKTPPPFTRNLDISTAPIKTFDLMESHLAPSGAAYTVAASALFKTP